MNGVRVRPYKADDFVVLARQRNLYTEEQRELRMAIAIMHEGSGPAFTFYDDTILAVAGIDTRWPGVGEMWAIVSEKARGRLGLIGAMKTLFAIEQENGWHRLQAAVKCKDEAAARFVEWLGFRCEGVMDAYGIDEASFYLYSVVRRSDGRWSWVD